MNKQKPIAYKKLDLKDIIQDCNINFLIGAGLSVPYLALLGQTEKLLTKLSDKKEISEDQEKTIRASLYKQVFDGVISKNIDILSQQSNNENNNNSQNNSNLEQTLSNYQNFLKTINTILLNRKSSILSKQVNLFTTNFDIFLETALEQTNVEYNDGFTGQFNPIFDLSNFKKSIFKRTLHYDNTYELPVFNLMKIHGSLTWQKPAEDGNIYYHKNLQLIKKVKDINIPKEQLIDIKTLQKKESKTGEITIQVLIAASKNKKPSECIDKFINQYEQLAIINLAKEKFKETVLNTNYYELLRIYSNELEKENTVLFVMGFSFSDEHIREVTVRAANSNPTLKIYVFFYNNEAHNDIKSKMNTNNNNIQFVPPQALHKNDNSSADKNLDFKTLNKKIYEPLLKETNG